jgi:ubiquinone/menaquinone biosynthesis C-methylase UbiE
MLPIYKTPLHVFNYDEIPEGYYYHVMQNGAATQRYWHRNKFLAVAKKVNDGENVLDLGCGPGSFFSVLMDEKKQSHGIGVDVASTQIQFAAKEIGTRYPDRVKFVEYDPSRLALPFESGVFDVVTCIEVIEHLHPYLAYKLLEDAKRVLKPNGRIILTTPN